MTSPNGVDFYHPSSGVSAILDDVVFGDGRFVAVGASSTVLWSLDGVTWNGASVPPAPSTTLYSVAYGDGMFVAVGAGGQIFTSPDGDQWAPVASSGTTSALYSIGFDSVNKDWAVRTASSAVALHSPNGATWNSVSPPGTSYTTLRQGAIAHDGNNLWIMTGISSNWGTSTTGTSWTPQSTANYPYTGSIRGIAHDNGLWVAVGFNGIATNAAPLTTVWDDQTHPAGHTTPPTYQDVAYHRGLNLWITAGLSTRTAVSPGTADQWTPITVPATIGSTTSFYGVAARSGPSFDLAQTTLTATPSTIVANGASVSNVTLQLRDASGQPANVPGRLVSITTTSPLVTAGTLYDHNDGSYSVEFTAGTVTGTVTVTATVDGNNVPATVQIDLVPGPPSLTQSSAQASPMAIPADGVSTSKVTVWVRDAFGNAIDNPQHSASILPESLDWVAGVAPEGPGVYSRVLRSSTTAGSAQVNPFINGAGALPALTIEFLPGPPVAGESVLEVSPTSLMAGGQAASIVVHARDQFGNALAAGGATVVLTTVPQMPLTGAVDNGDGSFTATDPGDGRYTASLPPGTVAQDVVVSATLDGGVVGSETVEILPVR